MNGLVACAILMPGFFATTAIAQCATTWLPGAGNANGVVFELTTTPNGDVFVGGFFTSIGGVPANRIARWNGSSWSALGSGLNNPVGALTALSNGDVVAGGSFNTAGGVPAMMVARWNGSSWSAMGSGLTTGVTALTTLPNGDVVAGTSAFGGNVARWNGTSWSPLGAGLSVPVVAVAALPNGDVVASGVHWPSTLAPPVIELARWNGASWSPFGAGLNNVVRAMSTLPNGDLVVVGDFTSIGGTSANRIARWNGSSWWSLGAGIANGSVFCVTSLPNGDLVVGGNFSTFSVPGNGLARWDGLSWSPLGSIIDNFVLAVTASATGNLFAGGWFSTAGGVASQYLARLTTTCPATAVPAGSGCPSSGGSNTLVATSLPWTGSTFRVAGSGLPSLALVCVVTGFTTLSVPLFPLHSAGQAGCNLLVTPDAIDFLVTTTGACQAQLAVPNSATLAGIVVHRQMVPFEIDPALNVLAVTSTNAITATVGSF